MDLNIERIALRIAKEEDAIKKEEDLILKEERKLTAALTGKRKIAVRKPAKKAKKKAAKKRK